MRDLYRPDQFTTDDQDRRILRGLSFDETNELRSLEDKIWRCDNGDDCPWDSVDSQLRDRSRARALRDKHMTAQNRTLGAALEKARHKPTEH
jgi:hypothetical protein